MDLFWYSCLKMEAFFFYCNLLIVLSPTDSWKRNGVGIREALDIHRGSEAEVFQTFLVAERPLQVLRETLDRGVRDDQGCQGVRQEAVRPTQGNFFASVGAEQGSTIGRCGGGEISRLFPATALRSSHSFCHRPASGALNLSVLA